MKQYLRACGLRLVCSRPNSILRSEARLSFPKFKSDPCRFAQVLDPSRLQNDSCARALPLLHILSPVPRTRWAASARAPSALCPPCRPFLLDGKLVLTVTVSHFLLVLTKA